MIDWLRSYASRMLASFSQLSGAELLAWVPWSPLGLLIGLICGAFVLDYRRWIRLRILCDLSWAVGRNLPLDTMLAALEREAWGGWWLARLFGWRHIVSGIRTRLARGELIAHACWPWRRLFGAHRLAILAEAERAGRLDAALRSAVDLLREGERARRESKMMWFYPGCIALILCLFMSKLMVLIPSFEQLVRDWPIPKFFEIHPSPIGPEAILGRFTWMGQSWMMYITAAVLAGLGLLAYSREWPRGAWRFRIPGLGPLARLEAARNFLEVTAVLSGPGASLRDAFRGAAEAARYAPIRAMSRRLADGIDAGGDAADLIAGERLLPAPARELLLLGVRAGDPAAGCRRAADHLAGPIAIRRRALGMIAVTAAIGLMGAAVAYLAVTLFDVLIYAAWLASP